MIKNKLTRAIGKVDAFIKDLQDGIETSAQEISKLDTELNTEVTQRDDKVKKIQEDAARKVLKTQISAEVTIIGKEAQQDALVNDIKVAEALVANLTQLKS